MASSALVHQGFLPCEGRASCGESSRVHGGGLVGRLLNEHKQARSSALATALRGDGVSASSAVAPLPGEGKQASGRGTFQVRLDSIDSTTDEDKPGEFDFGLPRNLPDVYNVGDTIGKGGYGEVCLVTHRGTGEIFACKTIPKTLEDADVSDIKVQRHLEALKNELEVMRRLRGTLNVAHLEEAFEDNDNVYLVMEHCSGGELLHNLGQKHYSEDTVASVMRAVLRTLAQCHGHKILHLDVKPGNFMLLNSSETAPIKAIDFGLARTFQPEDLPLDNVGLEGTPWFMAPEMLSSQVTPACDIWAAGVMAFQLLTGHFPFDDKKNPMRPSINKIWKSILSDKINFQKSYWDDVSDEAKDFIKTVLNKDPSKRPTAKQLLQHPWLTGTTVDDRHSPKKKGLRAEVVQRIQRYGQSGLGRRSLLESLVEEILQTPASSLQGVCPTSGEVTTTQCNLALDALKSYLERVGNGQVVDYSTMAELLHRLGYRLEQSEMEHLMEVMDIGHNGHVALNQFVASQMDWAALERDHRELFEDAAQRAFANLDGDGDGFVSPDELCNALRTKLPSCEVPQAMEEVLCEVEEKEIASSCGKIDLDGFMSLLHAPSYDSLATLDQYDAKLSPSGSSTSSLSSLLAGLDRSIRDGSLHNSNEWLELEKSVKDNNLHNTEEWKQLEKSVKGAKTLFALLRQDQSGKQSDDQQ